MKKIAILIALFSIGVGNIYAQSTLERLGKKAIKQAGEQIEESIKYETGEEFGKTINKQEETDQNNNKGDEKLTESEDIEKQQVSLQSFSQYDFVPGDKLLLFEDFSQDAVGDFPALWTTNGSGEIKTVNITDGNWLHMTSSGNQYQLMKVLDLSDNYIIEFDVILPPTSLNHPAVWISLFNSDNEDLGYIENNPLSLGFGLYVEASDYNPWLCKAYNNGNWIEGSSTISPTKEDQIEHIIMWIQKRRLRVYHAGQKVLDSPTLIPINFKPNRLTFSLSDCNDATPFLSNIRITTASPDTRNKLLEVGKFISYGIYFDVNSDNIKPESFGALNDIAKVIKDANVNVLITGHTDNSGSNATNLDLSKRRAASVKKELVNLGVSTDVLTTDGAGASNPIVPNDNPSNKALNRRVEFVKQ